MTRCISRILDCFVTAFSPTPLLSPAFRMDAREHQPVLFGKGPSVACTRGTMYEHQPVLFGKGPSVACTRGTMYEHQPVLFGKGRSVACTRGTM